MSRKSAFGGDWIWNLLWGAVLGFLCVAIMNTGPGFTLIDKAHYPETIHCSFSMDKKHALYLTKIQKITENNESCYKILGIVSESCSNVRLITGQEAQIQCIVCTKPRFPDHTGASLLNHFPKRSLVLNAGVIFSGIWKALRLFVDENTTLDDFSLWNFSVKSTKFLVLE